MIIVTLLFIWLVNKHSVENINEMKVLNRMYYTWTSLHGYLTYYILSEMIPCIWMLWIWSLSFCCQYSAVNIFVNTFWLWKIAFVSHYCVIVSCNFDSIIIPRAFQKILANKVVIRQNKRLDCLPLLSAHVIHTKITNLY